MSDDASQKAKSTTLAMTEKIANSKAAEKLAGAVAGLVQLSHNVVDYIAGPNRVAALNTARAEGALLDAKTEAEIERIRSETAAFVFDREMRKTLNREAILSEAHKALPPPEVAISDDPVSADFVHQFFDEFDGISDPDVHKIAGRLLAGEVVHPGSFPRRTMRVLRDLESKDFALFARLCGFNWHIGVLTPVIFSTEEKIYNQSGINLTKVNDLVSLGLVSIEPLGYFRSGLPNRFVVFHGSVPVRVTLKDAESKLSVGKVLLTDAGMRLAPLAKPTPVAGLLEYVVHKWSEQGHKVEVLGSEPSRTTT